MNETRWMAAYTRKSRHMDKDIPEAELFRQHRLSLERKAADLGLEIPPDRYFEEVGTSESVAERPDISALLDEVDRLPRGAGGFLLVPDPDRITRGDDLERAMVFSRLQRAGIVIHSVIGGEIDLANINHAMLLNLKGLFSRWLIQECKAKMALTVANQIENGETRYGAAPWGYWQDKSEKLSRDRIKPDRREEYRVHAGLTPFEALQRVCDEVLFVPVRTLAVRYDVPASTLFTTLATPTICGWPAKKSWMDPDRLSKKNRQRKLKREEWVWPKKQGTYEPACSRERWHQIQEALASRRCGKVKWGGGEGACREVLAFEGLQRERVVLARTGYSHGEAVPAYRFMAQTGEQRDVEREPVDAAARAALGALFADVEFFTFMIETYYRQRKADPLPIHEEVAQIEGVLRQWRKEYESLRRLAARAEIRLLQDDYNKDALKIAKLIEAKERELEEVRQRRSPIPEVDQIVRRLVHLRQVVPIEQWGAYIDRIWERLSPLDRTAMVRAFIKAVPVRYTQRVKGARGTREILPVEYSEFVMEARQQWQLVQQLPTCSTTVRQSYNERWRHVEVLLAA
jgi:resolvase-like protein